MVPVLHALYGLAAYLFFVATVGYAIAFVGNLPGWKSRRP